MTTTQEDMRAAKSGLFGNAHKRAPKAMCGAAQTSVGTMHTFNLGMR